MSSRRGALSVYVAAATTARSADAGAVVAAVLAGTAAGGPAAGGLLAAALTIPHLVGPIAGRLLDGRTRPGPLLAAAFCWYAAFVVAAAALLPVGVGFAAGALAVAGCAGPLVTGGLSSRLGSVIRGGQTAQRRGQALDALTYGVAGAVGPAIIAVAATVLSPGGALAATAGLLVLAAIPVSWLAADHTMAQRAPSRGSIFAILLRSGPLRRTSVATIGSAAALAAAPVVAAALAASRGADPAIAAVLMSFFGVGGLVAALALIAHPLTGDPERLVRRGVAAVGAALLLPLAALPFPAAVVAVGCATFAAVGACSSALFAATLAARAEYSPPGAAARVFATVAGVKVAGSAVGVAGAGLVARLGAVPLVLCTVAVCALTLLSVAIDATVSRRHTPTSHRPPLHPNAASHAPHADRVNGSHNGSAGP
jgi:hypothetical protein